MHGEGFNEFTRKSENDMEHPISICYGPAAFQLDDFTEQPMKVRNCLAVAVAMMAITFASMQESVAQLPGLPFKRSKDTAASFELTEQIGPWLIMCYSFSGDDGPQQAKRLAAELRTVLKKFKLEAYTYTHRFDLAPRIQGMQLPAASYVRDAAGNEIIGADGKPLLVNRRLSPKESRIVETAVLVGGFGSVDDERAQEMLAAIKRYAPKSLMGGDPDALADDDALAGGKLKFWRESVARAKMGEEAQSTLRNAFLLPNPLLPEEYFAARSIDKFVIDLNRKVRKYSLLDCPGKYSVRVATFRGKTVINSSKIKQQLDDLSWRSQRGEKVQSELAVCANKANMLTKALRADGIEAWEFHDREESYVCVGSFDWLKKVDASGNEVQNPEIRQTIAAYKGNVQFRQGQPVAVGVPVPKSLRGLRDKDAIAYDIQPLPVIAPKATTPRRASLLSRFRR